MRDLLAVAVMNCLTMASATELPEQMTEVYAAQPEIASTNGTPSVTITREGLRLSIAYSGTLQSAPAVNGPWADVTNAVSPFSIDSDQAQQFFRARTNSVSSIFSSRSVVPITIIGSLQEHFEKAFAGLPDGIFPPLREKPYFNGTLKMAELELPVSLRVRGNSSLQECPFPKLKFKVAREHRTGTPFVDAREIKIGTHCAEGGRGNVGRLRDETATYREALAYEALDLFGFTTPRVRRARIEYRDTTPAGELEEGTGWQISRNALILDDIEVVAERLGGRALDDEEISALKNAGFDAQLVTDLQLFHALIGNWDYKISANGVGLWNTDVIELPNKQLVPIVGDFDLSTWVTGEPHPSAPHDYRPELPPLERQIFFDVEQIRLRVGEEQFAAGIGRLAPKREALESLITSSDLDEPGRTNALKHVQVFFSAVESIKR